MDEHETLRGGELEAVSQRFRRFIVDHSVDTADSGIGGSLRDGVYGLNVPGQLIPVDRVVLSVFDFSPEDEQSDDIGYFISLNEGEIDRYSIQLGRDSFHESDTEFGVDYGREPLDPAVVSSLLDYLEVVESVGGLSLLKLR